MIEAFLPHDQQFIPNDVKIGADVETGLSVQPTEKMSIDDVQEKKHAESSLAAGILHLIT